LTGVLSSSSRNVIRRNAAYLPAYSFTLGSKVTITAGVDAEMNLAPAQAFRSSKEPQGHPDRAREGEPR
jgi:hypothetical protein